MPFNIGGPAGNKSSPTQIGTDTTWSILTGGGGRYSEACAAIKTDGTLWTWGLNNDGELGLNDEVQRSSPTQVPGTTWHQLSGTNNGFFAIKQL